MARPVTSRHHGANTIPHPRAKAHATIRSSPRNARRGCRSARTSTRRSVKGAVSPTRALLYASSIESMETRVEKVLIWSDEYST
eukprot:3281577-Prymnesium_polylepis.1